MRLPVLVLLALAFPGFSLGATGQGAGKVVNPGLAGNSSSTVVTATGSTSARPLKDRFAESVNVKDFGAKGDGSTDDTAAFAAAAAAGLSSGAPIVVPPGTYRTNGIPLKTGQRLLCANHFGSNATRAGVGAGAAILKARDNSTAAVIEVDGVGGTVYEKEIEIGGCVIHGPSGPQTVAGIAHGIYVHDGNFGGHSNIWIHDVDVAGVGGRGIYMPTAWHTTLDRVGVDNVGDNAFELQGGNTTVLTRCYGHKIASGKAAFRIYGRATLIACNGIDASGASADWGVFGKAVALGDDVDSPAYIAMINCNVEDYTRYGVWVRGAGGLSIYNTTMWAPPTGTVTAIRFDGLPLKGNVLDSSTSIGTKGATWVNGYAIHSNYTPFVALGDSGNIPGQTFANNYWNLSSLTNSAFPQVYGDSSDGSLGVGYLKVGGTSGSRLKQINTGSIAWTPGTIANGASASVDITSFPFVASAVLSTGGYTASAGFSLALPAGVVISAAVQGNNTVKVTIANLSGGPVTLGAGTVRATVVWGG